MTKRTQFRDFTMRQIRGHLTQVNRLMGNENWTIENMQNLNKYFSVMAQRTEQALAEMLQAIEEEKNVQTKT